METQDNIPQNEGAPISEGKSEKIISFCQGDKESKLSPKDMQNKIGGFLSIKNVNFLFGAGVSMPAIPAMKQLEEAISNELGEDTELKELYDKAKGEVGDANLENTLTILYAKKFYLEGVVKTDDEPEQLKTTTDLIKHIEDEIYKKINISLVTQQARETINLYKDFYQRISLRNKDLSRLNIFTTNCDLLNEKALDELHINYNNGFSSGLERIFNPGRFNYTFSKKIDMNLEKYEPLENMVYLYKLHGSLSWIERGENELFDIYEIPINDGEEKSKDSHVLIYPTPLKQEHSLGSPYSDLIREFQTKLSLPNSVLFIIGYSFSDQHLNNVIYRSLLSNSTLSIVIFGEHKESPLSKIGDNRIYRIYSESEKVHYLDYIVKELLPDADSKTDVHLLKKYASGLKEILNENANENR